MRLCAFVLSAALALAGVAGQNTMLRTIDAENSSPPAITDCAREGAAVQGDSCPQLPLDSTPGAVVAHAVLAGACSGTDLHVVRFISPEHPEAGPVVASWCS
jgi:hypothetical protein